MIWIMIMYKKNFAIIDIYVSFTTSIFNTYFT